MRIVLSPELLVEPVADVADGSALLAVPAVDAGHPAVGHLRHLVALSRHPEPGP